MPSWAPTTTSLSFGLHPQRLVHLPALMRERFQLHIISYLSIASLPPSFTYLSRYLLVLVVSSGLAYLPGLASAE